MDGIREAVKRLQELSRAPFLTKSERDAVRYALVIIQEVEQTFDYEGGRIDSL